MAKIGNETKLVLKLAKERLKGLKEKVRGFKGFVEAESYVEGMSKAERIFEEIIEDLESGK